MVNLVHLVVDHPSCRVIPAAFSSGLHVEVERLLVNRLPELIAELDVFPVRLGPRSGPASSEPEKDAVRTVDLNFDAATSLPELELRLQRFQMGPHELDVVRLVPVFLETNLVSGSGGSVTSKKSPNVSKSCPKMILLEK